MCGIVGVLLYPRQRSAEAWRQILDVTTTNLLGNEERGKDAAGIAVIQANGRYALFKQPVAASTLVEMPGYLQTLSTISDRTVCILAHTRMPTKGSRWHNANNHPIRAGHVIGVHNGVIRNDDALFAQYDLPRAGEVDSEIIFRLQDSVDPLGANGTYCSILQCQSRRLEGRFATLSVDLRQPTRLTALKYLRPLCLHYEAELAALFFSSRYVFLRRAFGRSVITEALDSGWGFCFNALRLQDLGSEPVERFQIHAPPPRNLKPRWRSRIK
jgi:glucosamine 6-phosphate synthetase-like amidotransferase/phosphosugar isomerase protein